MAADENDTRFGALRCLATTYGGTKRCSATAMRKGFGTRAGVTFRTSNLNLMLIGARWSRAVCAMARSRMTTKTNDDRERMPIATVTNIGEQTRLIG